MSGTGYDIMTEIKNVRKGFAGIFMGLRHKIFRNLCNFNKKTLK